MGGAYTLRHGKVKQRQKRREEGIVDVCLVLTRLALQTTIFGQSGISSTFVLCNMSRQSTQLVSGWTFRQHQGPSTEWLPVEKVPTQVHTDLLANKKYAPILPTRAM